MKKLMVLVAVTFCLVSNSFAQGKRVSANEAAIIMSYPVTSADQVGTNLVIRRDADRNIQVFTDRTTFSTRMYARVTFPGGEFRTPVYQFAEFYEGGALAGIDVTPKLSNVSDIRVEAFKFEGTTLVAYTQAAFDTSYPATNLLVAYEEQKQTPSGTKVQLKIIGDYDPTLPAAMVVSWTMININVISSIQIDGNRRETIIGLDSELVGRLSSSYFLTITQAGISQTVPVQHMPLPTPLPTVGGKG